jgi:uncharacterized delta-60 repeat protein
MQKAAPRGTARKSGVTGSFRRHVAVALLWLAAPTYSVAAPGDLDPAFGTAGIVTTSIGGYMDWLNAMVVQGDGKLVAAGYTRAGPASDTRFALVRYNSDGMLDSSFGTGGFVETDLGGNDFYDEASALAVQGDGKLVAAGYSFANSPPDPRFAVVRYNADGSLDNTFGSGGMVLTEVGGTYGGYANALAIQDDGRLVVAGWRILAGQNQFTVARYTAGGLLDPNFGAGRCSASQNYCDVDTPCLPGEVCGGVVVTTITGLQDEAHNIVVQSDGKLVVSGRAHDSSSAGIALVRYNADGSLDSGFGTGGVVRTTNILSIGSPNGGTGLVLQPDGKLVVSGTVPVDLTFGIMRFNTNGTLDTAFGASGIAIVDIPGPSEFTNSLLLQTDGKIVAAGSGNDVQDFALARVDPDGSPDSTFGSDGIVVTSLGGYETAYSVALQPDGKLVAAGSTSPDGSSGWKFALARYLVDCPAAPRDDCRSAGVSNLVVKDNVDDRRDALTWKWSKGEATSLDEIADPTTTGRYQLCLYPDAVAFGGEAIFPSSLGWKSIPGRGFQYADADRVTGGVGSLLLRTGEAGRASLRVKAKGVNMPDELLPATSYRLQLLDGVTGICWGSEFSSGDVKPGQFRGKTIQ